jgi:hypothetical protein
MKWYKDGLIFLLVFSLYHSRKLKYFTCARMHTHIYLCVHACVWLWKRADVRKAEVCSFVNILILYVLVPLDSSAA